MKTGKKITVGLAAALVVAIFAGGAVSMVGAQYTEQLSPFTVTVSAFDVSIDLNETDFGEVLPGMTKEIHTYDVINAGIIDADVEARFLTNEGEESFGLVGGSVILAENFELNNIPLNNDGSPKVIAPAPAGTTTPYNAKLTVPALQPDANYAGTVELIISPDI